MEEFQENAKIYYQVSPKNVQDLAQQFFESMNPTQEKKVELHQFLSFMTEQGYTQMSNRHFFKELSGGGDQLDFWQVMTLFYIVKSGRGFCGGCGCFLYVSYFTCVTCFDTSPAPFSVCRRCFRLEQYAHKANHHFLDDAVLLETKRQANLKPPAPAPTPRETYTGPMDVVAYDPNNAFNFTTAIFRNLVTAASIATSLVRGCSIM